MQRFSFAVEQKMKFDSNSYRKIKMIQVALDINIQDY